MNLDREFFERLNRERERLLAATNRLDSVLAEAMSAPATDLQKASEWEARFSECCEEMALRMEVIENLLGTISLIIAAREEGCDEAGLRYILRQFPHEKWTK